MHDAAHDLFDELDASAEAFGEVSCIAKRDGRLVGSAKDPLTARLALDEFLPADHFASTGAAALVLGSGGAGTALSQQLGVRADAPAEVICTALDDRARWSTPGRVHARSGVPDGLVRYVRTAGPQDVAALVERLPAGSLVVNATGMGKDRPGSPLPDGTAVPGATATSGSSTTAGASSCSRRRVPSRTSVGSTSRTGGATSCTAGRRRWPRSSPYRCRPETVDELGRVAAGTR